MILARRHKGLGLTILEEWVSIRPAIEAAPETLDAVTQAVIPATPAIPERITHEGYAHVKAGFADITRAELERFNKAIAHLKAQGLTSWPACKSILSHGVCRGVFEEIGEHEGEWWTIDEAMAYTQAEVELPF